MPVDPTIALNVGPTPNMGPNLGRIIDNAAGLVQLDQQKQQIGSQNALKQILGTPGAVDENGNPTGDAMSKIMGVSPEFGIKMKQNALASMQQQEQMRTAQFKRMGELSDLSEPMRMEAYKVYQDTPGDPATKQAAAQQVWTERRAGFVGSGHLSQAETEQVPTDFNLQRVLANSPGLQKQLVEQQKLDLQTQREKREKEHQDLVDHAARYKDTPVMIPDPDHPGQQIPGIMRVDTRSDADPIYVPMKAGTTVAAKPPAAGSVAATRLAVQDSLKKQHPDWDASQIDLAAEHAYKQATAQDLPGDEPLTPSAIQYAAQIYREKGLMPNFGQSKYGASDRRRIINQAAGNADAEGATAGDDIVSQAVLAADKSTIVKLTQQRAAISGFEQTALANGKVLVDLAKKVDKTGVPVVDRWIRAGRSAIQGDPDVTNFNAQLQLYGAEVARIVTNPNMTGVLSDSARKEVQGFLPAGASYDQIKSVTELLEGDFGRRTKALDAEMATVRDEMKTTAGGKRPPATAAEDKAPPPPPASTGGLYRGDTQPAKYPDAKKAPDGNWYIPPKAPGGKYLAVEADGAPAKPAAASTAAPAKADGKTAQTGIKVTTPEEAAKLPAGTWFVPDDGIPRQRHAAVAPSAPTN